MANEPSRTAIHQVKKRVEHELLSLPNVHAVDIQEKITKGEPTGELAIVVYVDTKKNVAAKSAVPKEIEGIKTDVQEEEPDVLHPALVLLDDDELLIDTTRYATLEGGMSMGPCRSIFMEPPDVEVAGNYITVGTLGAIVRDKATNNLLALTNFHVAAVNDSWSVGDDMAQPARNDGGACPADRFGAIERGVLSADVDGAVVSIDDRSAICEILEIGDVAGTRAAVDGMSVRKRGRTTELSHGEVISTTYTTTIDYGDGLGPVTLVDQIRIKNVQPSAMFGTNGDSGSVVVDDDRNIVGLYFAGNSSGTRGIANPIAKVLTALNIEVCTKPIVKPFKEWLKWEKSEKPEKIEKIEIKEKPEKFEKIEKIEKFEKIEKPEKIEKFEKPEKLEKPELKDKPEKLEKKEFEGPKSIFEEKGPVSEKDPRLEKDPIIEKGPINEKDPRLEKDPRIEKDPRAEKGPVGEKGFAEQPGPSIPGVPRATADPFARFGPRDPFAEPLKNFFDKRFPEVAKPPKGEFKEKAEWKESKNESKENKEFKDQKDQKEKEFMFDVPPGGGVVTQQSGAQGYSGAWGPEAHPQFHFIPQHLRPDLSRGALGNEQY